MQIRGQLSLPACLPLFIVAFAVLPVDGEKNNSIASPPRTFQDYISLINTGGRNQPCNLTHGERIDWVEYCYSDFGVLYDVWWWAMLLVFLGVFVWSSRNTYLVFRNRKNAPNKSMLEPNVVIMNGNFVACVFRFLFLIKCFNGRSPGGSTFHYSLEDLLVTAPQIILLSEYLIMSVVWSSIIEMTKTMRSIDRKQSTNGLSDEGNRKLVYVTVFAITLFTVLMVLQILPLFVPSWSYMANVVNLVKIGGAVPAIIVAVITVSKLSKLLTTIGGGQAKNASQSQFNAKAKREALVKQIRTSVFLSASASIVAIAATVLAFTTVLKTPYPRRLIFWTIIHLFEATCIVLISNSISYKDRKFGAASLRSAINVPSSSAGARDSSLRYNGKESKIRSGNVATLRGEGGISRSSSKTRRGNSGVAGTSTSKANSIHPFPGELQLPKQSNADCSESIHGAEKALH